MELSSKQVHAAATVAAEKAAKAAAEDATTKSGTPATSSRTGTGSVRSRMDPKQVARLEALKGKYGTHVASNMKQQFATKTGDAAD